MSLRNGLLALLKRGPSHGYQLRAEIDELTASAWPVNIGQIYTTLDRLERDGFIETAPPAHTDGNSRVVHSITSTGEREVMKWFAAPVDRADRPRDELALKLALALTTPGIDVSAVVQTQRTATLQTMQDLTRVKSKSDTDDDAWLLVIESLIFQAEAEIRWLDHCETRLVSRARNRQVPRTGSPDVSLAPAPDTSEATGTTERPTPTTIGSKESS